MFLESLERRRLLAFSVIDAKIDAGGKLTIQGGTGTSDNIAVIEQGPPDFAPRTVRVQDLVNNEEMTFNGVTKVSIDGRKGNDTILWLSQTLNATIQGGSGADRITADDAGTGSSSILGSNGNDVIAVVRANGTFVDGGSGDDQISVNSIVAPHLYQDDMGQWHFDDGGATAASLVGERATVKAGDGNDTILLYSGSSTVDGGGRVDLLIDESLGYATYTATNVEPIRAAIIGIVALLCVLILLVYLLM